MPNKPKKYTTESILSFCKDNEIILTSSIPELGTLALSRSIINEYLDGQCKTVGCTGIFHSKIYQLITQQRYYCPGCAKQLQQDRSKKTLLETHGVDHPMKSKVIKDRVKSTTIERYGVDNVAKLEVNKEKARQTNLEKRGVEWSLQDPEVRKKAKETMIEKFDVEFASQNKGVQLKTRETTMERFGYEYASQHPDNRMKVEATNMGIYI
jgi:hypothetical protein